MDPLSKRIKEMAKGKSKMTRKSIQGDSRISFTPSLSLQSSIVAAKDNSKSQKGNEVNEIIAIRKPKVRIDRMTMYEKNWADIMSKKANGSESEDSEEEMELEDDARSGSSIIGTKCKTLDKFDYSIYAEMLNREQLQNNCLKAKLGNIKNRLDNANRKMQDVNKSCHNYKNPDFKAVREMMS